MAKQLLGVAAPVLLGTMAPSSVLALRSEDHMAPWYSGWAWGHMIFGPLMMVLFWGVIIVAIVFAIRWIAGKRSDTSGPQKTPIDILRERYARGEIDKEEFEERKRHLSE